MKGEEEKERSSNYRWVRPTWTEEERKVAHEFTEKMIRKIAEEDGHSEEWVQAMLHPQSSSLERED